MSSATSMVLPSTLSIMENSDMVVYYFTFGYGTRNRNNFVRIEGEDYADCRNKMVAVHGTKWAMQYPADEFLPQIERYHLIEIPLS